MGGNVMASNLKPDYQPPARVYDNLRKYGCVPEFVESQIDHFKVYWLGLADQNLQKAKKSNWDSTCFNWMKRAWQGKTGREWEKHRHTDTRYKSSTDPFEAALDLLPKPDKVIEPPKDFAPPPIPLPEPKGMTMAAEEAFSRLREMGIL